MVLPESYAFDASLTAEASSLLTHFQLFHGHTQTPAKPLSNFLNTHSTAPLASIPQDSEYPSLNLLVRLFSILDNCKAALSKRL